MERNKNSTPDILTTLENVFTQNSEQTSELANKIRALESRLKIAQQNRDAELLKDNPNFAEIELHNLEIEKIKKSISEIRKSLEDDSNFESGDNYPNHEG